MKVAVILAMPIEYNSSSMLRCKTLISAMIDNGNDVRCYAPFPDVSNKYYSKLVEKSIIVTNYGKQNKSINLESLKKEKKGLKKRIKLFLYRIYKKFDIFGSSILYLPYRKMISREINNSNYDLIISFSDPMPAHMIANYCKKHNKKLKYVQQWGDPLASDTISKIALPVWIRKIMERRMIRFCDRVYYVSPFTCDEQKRLYPKYSKKMFFLPTPSINYCDTLSSIRKSKICLGYFGSYYSSARNLLPFYYAACKIKDIEFLIIGDSDIVLDSTENIIVKNRMKHDDLMSYFSKTDVIVCLMNSKGNQIPGKVYHDASTSKDILFIVDGEYGEKIENYFSKYDHYTFVKNNEEDICNVLYKYIKNGVPYRNPVSDFEPHRIARDLISF